MSEVFEPEVTIVVGATGMGKSTWIANFIKRYKRNVIVYKHAVNINDKAFPFLPEKTMSNWRQGVPPGGFVKCKMCGEEEEDWQKFLQWCKKNFRHGLVVLDDSQMFELDRPSRLLKKFLIMKRHYAMNIFVVYHGLSLIPVEVFPLAQKIVLFYTTDNINYRQAKISNPDLMKKAIEMARSNALTKDKQYTPIIMRL